MGNLLQTLEGAPERSSEHAANKRGGIELAIWHVGDGCAHCRLERPPGIYDIGPTLLERLGLPLSAQFIGQPLPLFESAHPTTTVEFYGAPLGTGSAVASGFDPEMNEKLRAQASAPATEG